MVGGMGASSSASTLSCPIARNIVVRSVSESPTWRWTNSGTASTKTDLISYEFGARRTKELFGGELLVGIGVEELTSLGDLHGEQPPGVVRVLVDHLGIIDHRLVDALDLPTHGGVQLRNRLGGFDLAARFTGRQLRPYFRRVDVDHGPERFGRIGGDAHGGFLTFQKHPFMFVGVVPVRGDTHRLRSSLSAGRVNRRRCARSFVVVRWAVGRRATRQPPCAAGYRARLPPAPLRAGTGVVVERGRWGNPGWVRAERRCWRPCENISGVQGAPGVLRIIIFSSVKTSGLVEIEYTMTTVHYKQH